MIQKPYAEALAELRSRSLALAAVYRDWGRRLPPGPVTRLAMSIAEQRLDLSKTLGELEADYSLHGLRIEFDAAPAEAPAPAAADAETAGPADILKKMAAAEAADHEFLAAVAGATLAASPEAAERLAAEAASARKRSIWAQDQLELLDMLGPKP